MRVLSETHSFLVSRGIRLIAGKAGQACQTFNELADTETVLGAFQLTY